MNKLQLQFMKLIVLYLTVILAIVSRRADRNTDKLLVHLDESYDEFMKLFAKESE